MEVSWIGVMAQFEIRALFLIVPFAAAVLLGCLCICKHKVELWRMKKDDPEEPPAQPKLVVANAKKASPDVDKHESPSDTEAGNRGAESESESEYILEPGKPRKSLCG